ncbi:MAG: hypothetical protein C0483_08725 [Pirellula sp.]|nr:hypothetical protein [Pirellula sp.]
MILARSIFLAAFSVALLVSQGCETKQPTSATAGSAGPKLSSTDPAERAAAAREAAEKYGAKP